MSEEEKNDLVNDNDQSNIDNENTDPNNEDFGEAGIKALRAERNKVKELKKKISMLENNVNNSTPSDADLTLKEQLSFLTNGNVKLTKELEDQKKHYEQIIAEKDQYIQESMIKSEVTKICVDNGLDPNYLDLFYKSNKDDFLVVDNKIAHNSGVELEPWVQSKKYQYPDLFRVKNPGGVDANSSNNSVSKKAVSRSNSKEFFANLDNIAEGKTKVIE